MSSTFRTAAVVAMICLLVPAGLSAQMKFKKVEARTSFGTAEEGNKGKLIIDGNSIKFVKKNEKEEYFSIPSDAVTEVFYSRVSGRRVKTAIFLTGAVGLFLKGKKHYMTLAFNDGDDIVGAVEFKLDKKNYRGILRATEQVTGAGIQFDQEGIKDEKESFATSSSAAQNGMAVVDISSEPRNAEIEIDGAFAGTTPRSKKLKPGEYKVKIALNGYKSWEKKIVVGSDEEFPISVQLEKN